MNILPSKNGTIIIMNTNKFLIPLIFAFFLVSCAGESSTSDTVDITDDSNVVEVNTAPEEVKVDSAEIKRLAEEEATAKAEEERLAKVEAEKIAKAERDSIRRAKRKLAALKKKKEEEERRKAAEAEAQAAVVNKPVTTPSQPVISPPTPPKPAPANKKGPKIEFVTKTYNFGTIKEGDVVKYEFEYTNTGTGDLVIKDANATCGCTAPGFSFFPLEPGLSSAISVSFNSANKVGAQRPEVTIITNGYPSKHVLTMEGIVVK